MLAGPLNWLPPVLLIVLEYEAGIGIRCSLLVVAVESAKQLRLTPNKWPSLSRAPIWTTYEATIVQGGPLRALRRRKHAGPTARCLRPHVIHTKVL